MSAVALGVYVQHSVWNWDTVQYNYFTSDTPASVGGWRPLTGLGVQNRVGAATQGCVGIDIEAALPMLPPNARPAGAGPQAVGQLCRRPVGGAGLGVLPLLIPLVYFGGAAFFGLLAAGELTLRGSEYVVDATSNPALRAGSRVPPADPATFTSAEMTGFVRPAGLTLVYAKFNRGGFEYRVRADVLRQDLYAEFAPALARYMASVTPAKLEAERGQLMGGRVESARLDRIDAELLARLREKDSLIAEVVGSAASLVTDIAEKMGRKTLLGVAEKAGPVVILGIAGFLAYKYMTRPAAVALRAARAAAAETP